MNWPSLPLALMSGSTGSQTAPVHHSKSRKTLFRDYWPPRPGTANSTSKPLVYMFFLQRCVIHCLSGVLIFALVLVATRRGQLTSFLEDPEVLRLMIYMDGKELTAVCYSARLLS